MVVALTEQQQIKQSSRCEKLTAKIAGIGTEHIKNEKKKKINIFVLQQCVLGALIIGISFLSENDFFPSSHMT